jgi:Protein of unknown function (DUF4127)
MKTIVGLPVDARPVVRSQVQSLVACAGWNLSCPPKSMLGHFREPARFDDLRDWLAQHATTARGVVLSLDMLIYGGLVPSRFIEVERDALLRRLDFVRELKAIAPNAPIYAFAATMRISNNNVNEEEKTYWSEYGEAIWRWSYHQDRFECLRDERDDEIAERTATQIPEAIRHDYLATRARNHALTLTALSLVEEGTIDRLILPQDDTAEFGFNIRERRELQRLVGERRLQDRVSVYAGADEVMHTLCAHLVSRLEACAPTKFFVLPSDPEHVGQLVARYEDRPIVESLSNQVHAVNGVLVDDAPQADVVIVFHTQGTTQGDWAMQLPLLSTYSIGRKWINQLIAKNKENSPIALLDCAYANGADPQLIGEISKALPLNSLCAYAGWNTASNAIGSALAQCVLARMASDGFASAENRKAVALRLLEDYLYQAIVRQVVRIGSAGDAMQPEALRDYVASVFTPLANAWLCGNDFPFRVVSISLPWNRTFEIDIELASVSEAVTQ